MTLATEYKHVHVLCSFQRDDLFLFYSVPATQKKKIDRKGRDSEQLQDSVIIWFSILQGMIFIS